MFRRDAVGMATGVCTLGDVIARNEGKVFPSAPPGVTGVSSYIQFQDRVFQEIKDMEACKSAEPWRAWSRPPMPAGFR
jgi:hypothetical protein